MKWLGRELVMGFCGVEEGWEIDDALICRNLAERRYGGKGSNV